MVPDGWTHTTFDKHIDLLSGFAFKSNAYTPNENDIRLLRGDNIEPGSLRWRDAKRWPKEKFRTLEKYHLEEGDFVIAMDRTWISTGLKVAEVKSSDLPCLLVQRVSRIRALSTLEQSLLRQYFSGHRFEQYVKSVQTETAVPHISAAQIKEFPVLLPPLPEQKKIAQILTTWDKAITITEQLLTNSQQQKKALMQQLLTGKKRLLDKNGVRFGGEWKQSEIGKFLTESRMPSKTNDPSKRLTVRLNLKGIEQREFRGTEAVDSTSHFVRKAGQFIYGKQNIHKGAFGIIPKHLDGFETSQDLPAFDFTGACDSSWLFHFLTQESFFTSLEYKMSGTGSKRLNPKTFFKIKINSPVY